MTLGVLFDMDGVLVASGPAHAASWRRIAQRDGVAFTPEQLHATFGRPSGDIIRMLWGRPLSDDQVREIDDAKEAAYRDLISGMIPLTIGVRECLEELKSAGLRLAVATSGPPENVELVLREGRIGAYFETVVTRADVTRGKPAPDCFVVAAQRLNLPPDQCIVIEDAPVGIAAATAAGMRCIAFVGTHTPEALAQSGATDVVRTLADITSARIRRLLDHQHA